MGLQRVGHDSRDLVSILCISSLRISVLGIVVKQEMPRVNVDIIGISELKWTGMGEFNSDDHYIYYCGQESSEEME